MSVFLYALCQDCEQQLWIGEIAGPHSEWIVNGKPEITGAFFKEHGRHRIIVVDDENPVYQEELENYENLPFE